MPAIKTGTAPASTVTAPSKTRSPRFEPSVRWADSMTAMTFACLSAWEGGLAFDSNLLDKLLAATGERLRDCRVLQVLVHGLGFVRGPPQHASQSDGLGLVGLVAIGQQPGCR